MGPVPSADGRCYAAGYARPEHATPPTHNSKLAGLMSDRCTEGRSGDPIPGGLGGHRGYDADAMSKQEVAALLCREGVEAGLWSVPEFEIASEDGKTRRIDVVWARRVRRTPGHLWEPIAAFEIEGHGVARDSIRKNADSLTAASRSGAQVLAMVLFQVGPDGKPWLPKRKVVDTVSILGSCLDSAASPQIEVVLDENLRERLGEWLQSVGS